MTTMISSEDDVRPWTDDVPKTHWGALIMVLWLLTQLAAGGLALYQGFSLGAALVAGWFGAFYLMGALLIHLFV